MKYITLLKILGVGILGGAIPLVIYLSISNPYLKLSEQVIDGNRLAKNQLVNTNNPSGPADFTAAAESTINSVVHVTTKVIQTTFQRDPFQEFFYGPGAGGRELKQYGAGAGSGVIISSEGYIVTNHHVIEDCTNSDNELIVKAGIVSAKARNINILNGQQNKEIVPIESFIQTDAAVNPGNSGGALVNTRGELIGINTAIASQTGSYAGYSFAIPINLVQKVMRDIIDYGVVQRGFLGIEISDITQEMKTSKNLLDLKGVYVEKVLENGSAAGAGIKQGDVILKIGSKEVNSPSELQEEIGKRKPGDKIIITLRNNKGEEITKEMILKSKSGETGILSKEEISKNSALGATFVNLSDEEKKSLKLTYGVKVQTITSGKLKSIGLTAGTIITKINNEPITSVEELTTKLNSSNRGVLLEIMTESGMKDYRGFGL